MPNLRARLFCLVLAGSAALPLSAAAQLTVSTNSLTFAPTVVGAVSAGQAVLLTNSGTSAISLTGSAGSPAGADFSVSGDCIGSLQAGQSCTGFVTFKPSVTGLRSTPYNIFVANMPSPITVTFSGTGTPGTPPQPLTFSTSALSFAVSSVGSSSAAQTVVLSNPNGFAVTNLGSGFGGADAQDFVVSANTCGQTLPAKASCSVGVVFMPTGVGTRTASIQLNTTADAATQTISLTGVVLPTSITINALSPAGVVAEAYSFSIQIFGTGFTQGCTLQVGSSVVPTQLVDNSVLITSIPAVEVTTAKTIPVTVTCPTVSGSTVTSNVADFVVQPLPAGDTIVNQTAADIVYDPVHKLLYASAPSTAGSNPNSIVALDPTDGSIKQVVSGLNGPGRLAVSDNGQYLYAAVNGGNAVERFVLPALTPDILVPLGGSIYTGPYSAITLDVAPGAAHTWAVTIGNLPAKTDLYVYDDVQPRPSSTQGSTFAIDAAAWGIDASTLYAGNTVTAGFDLYVLPVTSQGDSYRSAKDYPGVLSRYGSAIHFDPTTKDVYSDAGPVINPATGAQVGLFPASGVMVPDGLLGKAFFVTQQQGLYPSTTLSSFDLTKDTPISSFVYPNVKGTVTRVRRFGANGLAFNETDPTDSTVGRIYLYQGSFVQ